MTEFHHSSQLPDFQSVLPSTNMGYSDKNTSNWYLLKRIGMEEEDGKFSGYQPSIHRNIKIGGIYSEASIIGKEK